MGERERSDGLGTVAHGVLGVVVDFDDQCVGAGGDRRFGHRRDQARFSRAVRRVDDNRQVALILQVGDRRQG